MKRSDTINTVASGRCKMDVVEHKRFNGFSLREKAVETAGGLPACDRHRAEATVLMRGDPAVKLAG